MVKRSSSSAAVVDNVRVPLDTKKIKALREALGWSQEKAAAEAGLPGRQRWNKIESGKVSNITLATIEKIAKALGCSPRDLILK